jgi:hypothetical protein
MANKTGRHYETGQRNVPGRAGIGGHKTNLSDLSAPQECISDWSMSIGAWVHGVSWVPEVTGILGGQNHKQSQSKQSGSEVMKQVAINEEAWSMN